MVLITFTITSIDKGSIFLLNNLKKNRLPFIKKIQSSFDLIGWVHGVLNIDLWRLNL